MTMRKQWRLLDDFEKNVNKRDVAFFLLHEQNRNYVICVWDIYTKAASEVKSVSLNCKSMEEQEYTQTHSRWVFVAV